jgi:tritrans,polycis-undecaprenyl-diphosphate synthase [geranylgeranyl-diphosphate specific]
VEKMEFSVLNPIYTLYKRRIKNTISKGPTPNHIGIILDGNRRHAKSVGVLMKKGYELGSDKLEEVLEWCWDLNIKVVSVWVFSTENFNRPKEQVDLLMKMSTKKMNELRQSSQVHDNGIKIRVSGSREKLPKELIDEINMAEKDTEHYSNHILNICLAYGGRYEILEATKAIAEKVEKGELASQDITEETIGQHLYTVGLPDPDLIIRSSGTERLSGFLMWQAAYSEFYFAECYWPMFREIDLYRAIRIFQQRQRNFGK